MSTYLEPGWIGHFAELWERLGPETRSAIIGLLPIGFSFDGKRVMDFGCGAGRTLKHFTEEAERAEIWGVDIDKTSIELLRGTVCPPFHLMRSGYMPPLELEGASFDLIWSISVFTHLTNDNSLPWLLELHRLLKPGGLLIATYMGRWVSEVLAGEPWEEDRVGMNVLRHDHPASDGAPLVLISDWWLREHWGRAFDVVQIAPEIHNQSWAVLRKRDVRLTVGELELPGDDPREAVALRHNIGQLQRELEAVKRRADNHLEESLRSAQDQAAAELDRVRRGYERSLSWTLTAPVRAAGRAVRALRGTRV
jgi:SAM-dependent methyltransferase